MAVSLAYSRADLSQVDDVRDFMLTNAIKNALLIHLIEKRELDFNSTATIANRKA